MPSTYLSRTPASAGNRKTWTWSGWVKRSRLNTGTQQDLFAVSTGSTTFTIFYFPSNADTLVFYQATSGGTDSFYSTEVQYFRDVSAWYHIVLAVDTTQATNTNRVKLYINGKEIQCTDTNKHGIVSWNFEKIREEYRDVLGMTPEENTKLCLETLFEMCNIRGRDHYLTLDSKYIDTAIFTAEFEMFGIVLFNQFGKPIDPENGPEKIEAKEIVYVSDVHKETYGDRLGKEHESKFFK